MNTFLQILALIANATTAATEPAFPSAVHAWMAAAALLCLLLALFVGLVGWQIWQMHALRVEMTARFESAGRSGENRLAAIRTAQLQSSTVMLREVKGVHNRLNHLLARTARIEGSLQLPEYTGTQPQEEEEDPEPPETSA